MLQKKPKKKKKRSATTSSPKTNKQKSERSECPVCARMFLPYASNAEINTHVDLCLSGVPNDTAVLSRQEEEVQKKEFDRIEKQKKRTRRKKEKRQKGTWKKIARW